MQRGNPMKDDHLALLQSSVQHNCHISDSRHGTEYGLCTYLMRMREYFRWEKGFGFSASLDKEEISQWLEEREALWEGLEEEDFRSLSFAGDDFDPFDNDGINARLSEQGLVYSGGYGRSGRPHFFLGELEHHEQLDGFSVLISGRELARDLASPPAMSIGRTMFIRRESLRRMLWEKLESWRWSRPDNALGRAFSCYDFEQDTDGALDAMTDHEIELAILHEKGECEAGKLLGDGWQEMLSDFDYTPAELIARAVRDHLADCISTLPALAAIDRPSSVHFFMGNLGGMRKEIFPGIQTAYQAWGESGDFSALRQLAEAGREHWAELADRFLELHQKQGRDAADAVARLATGHQL
ncbi:MAG: Sfum_1244 family protein [Sedimenticola sp.]